MCQVFCVRISTEIMSSAPIRASLLSISPCRQHPPLKMQGQQWSSSYHGKYSMHILSHTQNRSTKVWCVFLKTVTEIIIIRKRKEKENISDDVFYVFWENFKGTLWEERPPCSRLSWVSQGGGPWDIGTGRWRRGWAEEERGAMQDVWMTTAWQTSKQVMWLFLNIVLTHTE